MNIEIKMEYECRVCGITSNRLPKSKLCKKCYRRDWYLKNKEHSIEYAHKYYKENKGLIAKKSKIYRKKNKEMISEYNKRWIEEHKEERKEYMKQYSKTPKYKMHHRRSKQKRAENMEWMLIMENPFPKEIKIEWHHINNWFVIPLPKQIHQSVKTGTIIEKHRENLEPIIKGLYEIDMKGLLTGEW